jgi:isocitrate lyase
MNGLRWVGVRMTRCCPAFDVEKECFRHLRVSYFSWQKKESSKAFRIFQFQFYDTTHIYTFRNHEFSSDFERSILLPEQG